MSLFRRRVGHPAAVVAVLALAIAACSDESTAPSTTETTSASTARPSEVELIDAGAEDGRIELPGAPEVGQSGTATMAIENRTVADGPGVSEDVSASARVEMESEIVGVTDSGWVAETTITGVEQVGEPLDRDQYVSDHLVGMRFRQEFAADGTSGDSELANAGELTEEQRQAFAEGWSDEGSTPIGLPDEPVGVGARWSITSPVASQGFEIGVTYEFELTAIDGDEYTVELSWDEDVDANLDDDDQPARVTGTLSGSGTVSGSLGNPVLTNSSFDQKYDVVFDTEDGQIALTDEKSQEVEWAAS